MALPDFVAGLDLAMPFDRGQLETWAADVWPPAEDDPDGR
jgi:hypothetical protein